MNNIIILREGIDNNPNPLKWKDANLVICINPDGTIKLLKNRNGSNGLTGKCGEIFDTNVFLEDSKIKKPFNGYFTGMESDK